MYASDTQSPLRLMSSGPHYDHAYDPALNETHVGYWTTVWIDPVLNETYAGYWTTNTCYSTVLNGTFAGYWTIVHRLLRSSTKLTPAIGPQSLVI